MSEKAQGASLQAKIDSITMPTGAALTASLSVVALTVSNEILATYRNKEKAEHSIVGIKNMAHVEISMVNVTLSRLREMSMFLPREVFIATRDLLIQTLKNLGQYLFIAEEIEKNILAHVKFLKGQGLQEDADFLELEILFAIRSRIQDIKTQIAAAGTTHFITDSGFAK